ncbi:MAG: hypothetical protein HZB38_04765 [Planctomycetes bacterium]|nr:hypothetical protein [Planctomycetota bacterium]
MHVGNRRFARWKVVLLACGALLCAAGCARKRAVVALEQPSAPPSQREMTLASDWAFTARQDVRRLCLLDFPLPGAADGPRDFRLFVALPANGEDFTVEPGGAQGFLIQKVGRLRGMTALALGKVQLNGVLLQNRAQKLTIDATCADGTHITGEAKLLPADDELRSFLIVHAADVAQLDSAALAAQAEPATPDRGPIAEKRSEPAPEAEQPPSEK